MSEQPSLSYQQFRAHRLAEEQMQQQYHAYLLILAGLRRQQRRRKVFTVSAVVLTMFLGFCSLAYATTLQAAGVPGADLLVALRGLFPSGSLSELLRADFLALLHALVWIVGVMDDR